MIKYGKLLLLSLVIAACNSNTNPETQAIDTALELKKIEEMRSAFMLAIKEGRYQDLRQYAAQGIIALGPDSEGWHEMRKLGADRGQFPYDSIIMKPTETVIMNDSMAYDFGTSEVYYTNSEGLPVKLTDSFLVLLKKDNSGEWKLFREVATSTMK